MYQIHNQFLLRLRSVNLSQFLHLRANLRLFLHRRQSPSLFHRLHLGLRWEMLNYLLDLLHHHLNKLKFRYNRREQSLLSQGRLLKGTGLTSSTIAIMEEVTAWV